MWMQAEMPTAARHYHNVHDMVVERLQSLQKLSCLPCATVPNAKVFTYPKLAQLPTRDCYTLVRPHKIFASA